MKNLPLKFSNISIEPGERVTVALPTPELYTCAPMYIPIHVIHGKKAGPTLLICGAMHGDEVNGIAISQKLLKLRLLKSIRGTLIVIPTINVYGMITSTRNLLDRRDIESSFPGSKSGSFASRLAFFLSEEIFDKISHCIDLHTGEPYISKFPQIKTLMDDPSTFGMAHAFQAPVVLNTKSQQGLLWLLHKKEKKIPTILFETGEAFRLDPRGISVGVSGIVRVMKNLGMLSTSTKDKAKFTPPVLESEFWLRSPVSGLCQIFYKLGVYVEKGSVIAIISDPFGADKIEKIISPFNGIIISFNNCSIINEGERIIQMAEMKESVVEKVQDWAKEEDGGHIFE